MKIAASATLLGLLACGVPLARAADAPGVLLILEAPGIARAGLVPEAMPERVVLMEDGNVYVGGTASMVTARLEHGEVRDIEKGLDRVRKIQGLGTQVTFGTGDRKRRLMVRKGRPLDITVTGDTAAAPSGLRPLASLLDDLATFDNPALRPYRPAYFALSAREAALPGGCRAWSFPVPLAQALAAPQPVAAQAAEHWPTGGNPASVCSGDKRYVVTLRPLLPGEKP